MSKAGKSRDVMALAHMGCGEVKALVAQIVHEKRMAVQAAVGAAR